LNEPPAPPPPDLADPDQRAAYHRELRGVTRGMRVGGVAILIAGMLLALVRRLVLPGIPKWAAVVVVIWGAMLLVTAFLFRNAYHQRRMHGEG
jgi:peptidoglycan/LPS O-acetylase OafA/YrhL